MLVRFTVSNYLSFKNETILSMAAGKSLCHRNHLSDFRKFRILRSSCILGEEDSGKSDLISAVAMGRSVILNSLQRPPADNELFSRCSGNPALIRYDFTFSGNLYSYDFEFDSAGFTEEGLCSIGPGGSTVLFLRLWDPEHNRYETGGTLKKEMDDADCSDESWRRRLILTALKGQHPEFNDALEFFRQLIVISSGTVYSDSGFAHEMSQYRQELIRSLKVSDTVTEKDFAYDPEVMSRISALLPVLAPADSDRVFIIDGLDHGLPAGAVRKFLTLFFESGSSRSQLIFTADNPELMDMNLLRKDEIWYTERNSHGVPHLFSITGMHSLF